MQQPKPIFHVKICGVTRPEDGVAAARAGADAIGLNFFRGSKRFVEPEKAREICDSLPDEVSRVGVFVNASVEEVRQTVAECGLDYAQLHGDEPPTAIADLAGIPVIRAIRFRSGMGLDSELDKYRGTRLPDAVLVDAFVPDAFGGTGKVVDWQSLAVERGRLAGIPVVLAGGLKPGNVGDAIRAVRPEAVDTASGVESSAGIKDGMMVREFVTAARAAFCESDRT